MVTNGATQRLNFLFHSSRKANTNFYMPPPQNQNALLQHIYNWPRKMLTLFLINVLVSPSLGNVKVLIPYGRM